MFEPVLGSAPTSRARDWPTPPPGCGLPRSCSCTRWRRSRGRLMDAIEVSLREPITRTAGVGGTASTEPVTAAVVDLLARH